MRNLISRDEAVKIVGEELVNAAEQTNCENACYVTDGTEWAGYDVYEGYAETGHYSVKAVYLQDTENTKDVPLDGMEWNIEGYEVEEI
jgi:hypothetical protein